MQEDLKHEIKIEGRSKITVTGVQDVISLSEEKILLLLSSKQRLIIGGSNLKLGGFSVETGLFTAGGRVEGLKYMGEKSSFIKKILK